MALTVDFERDRHTSRTTGARLRSSSGVGSSGAPRTPHSDSRPRAACRGLRRLLGRHRGHDRDDATADGRRPRPRRSARTAAATSRCRRRARTAARRSRRSASIPRRRTSSSSRPTAARSRSRSIRPRRRPRRPRSSRSRRPGFYDNTIFHRIVPGLRDPGRRSDPGRERRAGLPDRRSAAGRLEVRRGCRRDGEDWAPRPPERPAASSSSSAARTLATLPPDYAIVGNVTSGMDTVKRIDGFGDVNDPSGTPTRPVVVESVTVEES